MITQHPPDKARALVKLGTPPAPVAPSDILTPAELSKRLKLPLSWIYEKSRTRGKNANPLPTLRCGRYLRFDWRAVCEWLRSNGSS
jgi:hypothetical protein